MIFQLLSKEIREGFLIRQQEQGNPRNPEVFGVDLNAGQDQGGFTWSHTMEGDMFWSTIISGKYGNKLIYRDQLFAACFDHPKEYFDEYIRLVMSGEFDWRKGDLKLLDTPTAKSLISLISHKVLITPNVIKSFEDNIFKNFPWHLIPKGKELKEEILNNSYKLLFELAPLHIRKNIERELVDVDVLAPFIQEADPNLGYIDSSKQEEVENFRYILQRKISKTHVISDD